MNQTTDTSRYSPRASLVAVGAKIQQLKLFETIANEVHITQKIIKHKPVEKLYDAFIAILAGAQGLSEINTRLRTDEALQRAFGRFACAEQSVVQDTLDACTEDNITEMERALQKIFQLHGQAARHNYRTHWQLLDIDLTGLPCGPKAEWSKKGYFAKDGIRYGRQLGRVIATRYEEIVVDRLYPGNAKLGTALQQLVKDSEELLKLSVARRARTILRMDAGGGSLADVNWLLDRGYQLHGKDCSSERAKSWAATVQEWFPDPEAPEERQYGWVVPQDTPDYVKTVRRIAIRWQKKNGHTGHAMLISTLRPQDVISLLGLPREQVYEPELVIAAYIHFYDLRGGGVETQFKNDKQGIGLTKRRKRRAEAQRMVMLLSTLAHNVLTWARAWLAESAPTLQGYGLLRLVRDVFAVTGLIETNENKQISRIVLNRGSTIASRFLEAFQRLVEPLSITVALG